jgi:hypothetical protein
MYEDVLSPKTQKKYVKLKFVPVKLFPVSDEQNNITRIYQNSGVMGFIMKNLRGNSCSKGVWDYKLFFMGNTFSYSKHYNYTV